MLDSSHVGFAPQIALYAQSWQLVEICWYAGFWNIMSIVYKGVGRGVAGG